MRKFERRIFEDDPRKIWEETLGRYYNIEKKFQVVLLKIGRSLKIYLHTRKKLNLAGIICENLGIYSRASEADHKHFKFLFFIFKE